MPAPLTWAILALSALMFVLSILISRRTRAAHRRHWRAFDSERAEFYRVMRMQGYYRAPF